MAFDERKIMRGTFGQVILDGEDLANIKSFQARIEFNKEDVQMARTMATHTRVMSYKGTGSISMHKIDSKMLKLLWNQIKEGKDPRFTIIGGLADPDSMGAERVMIENVSFDDLTIFDFEVGAMGTIETPFTFTNIVPIDEI
ncbi:phage tail tube protein [Clostridium sp.]|uniref:phage tail tube protein n=1 Tax=Clostridium sp. TaxID=1506 RepID=UPI003F40456D